MNIPKRSGAIAYGKDFPGYEPDKIPAVFWRKIEVSYPDGNVVTLVYEREPSDAQELRDLMWMLQTGAAEYGYKILITDADGGACEGPEIKIPR